MSALHEILVTDKGWAKLTADRKALIARRAELESNIAQSRAKYETVARDAVAAGELAPPPPPFLDPYAMTSGDFAELDRREHAYAAAEQGRLEDAIDARAAVLSTEAAKLAGQLQAIADEANLLVNTSRRIGTLAARHVRASEELDVDQVVERVLAGAALLPRSGGPAPTADAWNPFQQDEYARIGAWA